MHKLLKFKFLIEAKNMPLGILSNKLPKIFEQIWIPDASG